MIVFAVSTVVVSNAGEITSYAGDKEKDKQILYVKPEKVTATTQDESELENLVNYNLAKDLGIDTDSDKIKISLDTSISNLAIISDKKLGDSSSSSSMKLDELSELSFVDATIDIGTETKLKEQKKLVVKNDLFGYEHPSKKSKKICSFKAGDKIEVSTIKKNGYTLINSGGTDKWVKTKSLITESAYEEKLKQQREKEKARALELLRNQRWTGSVLTRTRGVNYGPSGRETYYNLNMSGVVEIMRRRGFSATEYPYWVRNDGVKMFGDYIMVAADLNEHPRGSVIKTSLGKALVCDTGAFTNNGSGTKVDIAVTW